MRYFITILFLLFANIAAQADSLVMMAGVGKNIMKQNGTPFERVGLLGYQFELPRSVFIRPQAAYFLDVSGETKSSMWGSVLVGVEARSAMGADLHLGLGPSYLQNPDEILGGHFQFNLEGCIGLSDTNVEVKGCWVHLSSGGIYQPNLGRDFIMAQVQIKFGQSADKEK